MQRVQSVLRNGVTPLRTAFTTFSATATEQSDPRNVQSLSCPEFISLLSECKLLGKDEKDDEGAKKAKKCFMAALQDTPIGAPDQLVYCEFLEALCR